MLSTKHFTLKIHFLPCLPLDSRYGLIKQGQQPKQKPYLDISEWILSFIYRPKFFLFHPFCFEKGCHVFLNLSKLSTSSWDLGKRWNSRRSLVGAVRLKHPAFRGRRRKKDGDKYVPTSGERSALLGGFCTILRVRCAIRGLFYVKKRFPPITSFLLHTTTWIPPTYTHTHARTRMHCIN